LMMMALVIGVIATFSAKGAFARGYPKFTASRTTRLVFLVMRWLRILGTEDRLTYD
jgi:hypothetical protein